MPVGTVKWFNVDIGFGFIAPDDRSGDALVYISAAEASGLGSLKEGDRVSYEVEPDRRSGKKRAMRLKVVG